ncbi:hypothetical protein IPF37_06020 [bacterium]|nr:MAG: hypothetical protein IPF37_06020 [bacterium]
MGICILKFSNKLNRYCQIKGNTQSDWLLGSLLVDSQGQIFIEWHLKWLYEKNSHVGGANCICCQKVGNDIIITSEFDDQEFPDECIIPKQTFVKLLEGWSEILNQLPPYVVIVHNGAELVITAHDHNPLEPDLQSK